MQSASRPALQEHLRALSEHLYALHVPGLHWHEYGKEPRPARKIGHATLTAPDQAGLLQLGMQVAQDLGGNWTGLVRQLF